MGEGGLLVHVGRAWERTAENENERGEREGRLKLLELVHGTSTEVQLHTHCQEVYGKKREGHSSEAMGEG